MIESPLDVTTIFDYDPGSLDAEIAKTESEVSKSMTEIARLLELKYKDCCPLFSALGECQEKIQSAIESASGKVDKLERSLQALEKSISQESAENPGKKLAAISRIIERLGTLSEVEGCLNELWMAEEDGNGSLLSSVMLVLKLESLGKEMEKEDTMENLRDRIIPLLFIETAARKSDLLAELDEFWKEFIRFPNVEKFKVNPGTVQMVVKTTNRRRTSENLTALYKLESFNRLLDGVIDFVWKAFCDRIIHAEDPACLFSSMHNDEGNIAFSIAKDVRRAEKPTVSPVFEELVRFLEALHRAFAEIVVDEIALTRRFGIKICDRLSANLVKDVLIPSIPSDGANSAAKEQLTNKCNEFHRSLKELGFLDGTNPLQHFIANFERYAVDKHCNYFVTRARELAIQPYIELTQVGSADGDEEESVGEIARKTDEKLRLGDVDLSRSTQWDKFSLKLFQFQKCKISKSTFDLVLLLQDCLLAAVDAGTEIEACRLLTTARNLIEIFTSIAPIHHQQALTTVPQIAAVFFNNCHYICHRLVSIKPDLEGLLAKSTKLPRNDCNFAEYFEELRKLAANILDQHLAQIRCQISSNLGGDDPFTDLRDEAKLKRCERSLNACTMQINQIALVWREVMPTAAFTHSVGVLGSHLLDMLVAAILSREDIASSDAELVADLFTAVTKKLERTLTTWTLQVNEEPIIHRACEGPYQRLNEIIFCLKASLAEIGHRWCEGKGLLAAWLKPAEVKKLIRALFQNTDRRAKVLSTIN